MVAVETRASTNESGFKARENQAISQFNLELGSDACNDARGTWEGHERIARIGCREALHNLDYYGWTAVIAQLALPEDEMGRIAILASTLDGRFSDNSLDPISRYRHHGAAARTALGVDWKNCTVYDSPLRHDTTLMNKLDKFGNLIAIPPLKKGIEKGFLREDADARMKDFLGRVLTTNIPEVNTIIERLARFNSKDIREALIIPVLTSEECTLIERVESGLISGDEQEEFKNAAQHGPVHDKDAAMPPITEDDLVSRLALLAGLPEKTAASRKYIKRHGQVDAITKRKDKNYRGVTPKEDAMQERRHTAEAVGKHDLQEGLKDYHTPEDNTHIHETSKSDTLEVEKWNKKQAEIHSPGAKMQPALNGEALKRAKTENELLQRIRSFENDNNAKNFGKK